MKKTEGGMKVILRNKKATFDYHIIDRYETGIELTGTEIKSIRQGKVNIQDAFCKIHKEEIFLFKMNITPYAQGGHFNHEPLRRRRLLMHRREIKKLRTKLQERGYTLIPLRLYLKRGWAKLELGLGKGKAKADKRQDLKKKDAIRDMRKQY